MTGRRIVVLALATAVLAGCGGDRAAPVVTRPTVAPSRPATTERQPARPTTTTTAAATTTTSESASTGSATTTTTSEPSTTEPTPTSSVSRPTTSTTSVEETTSTATETTGSRGAETTTSTSEAGTTSTVAETTTTAAQPSTTVAERGTTAPADPAWKAFDDQLAFRLIGGGDYAASVAVAVDGTIVHTGAYGVRVPALPAAPPPAPPPPVPGETPAPSLEPPPTTVATALPVEPLEVTDRFRIASLSKVITAIVVLQLVEAGQLGLDEPVGERLAVQVGALPVDLAINNITVRQLLSHTAGFPSYQRAFFNASVDSCPTIARNGLSAALQNPPGAAYEYSNLNYCLLGLLIEQVSGRTYEAVVQDRLLTPLEITGMRLVRTFDADVSEVVHPSYPGRNYMDVLGAAGSWVATPSDIVKIVDSLDLAKPGFHPLSSATVDLMRLPAPPPVVYDVPDRWYGLGLIVHVDGAWGHTGTIENAHSMVLHRPDGVTWTVLVNGENPRNSDQLRRIFDESIAAAGIVL